MLEAALDVFRTHGYSGASLDDLTDATGINRTSLYGAFGNKRALFEACVDHYWARCGSKYAAALFATGRLSDDLHGFFEAFLDVVCLSRTGGCVVACALPADAPAEPTLLSRLSAIVGQSDRVVAARLTDAAMKGHLPPDHDPERLAQVLVSVMFGLSLRARAGAPRTDLDSIASEAVSLVIGPGVVGVASC